MFRKMNAWLLAAAMLSVASCSKDFDARTEKPTVDPVSGIPYDFDWSLTRSVTLDIAVTSAGGGSADALRHTLRIYRSPLFTDGELLWVGSALAGESCSASLTVPASTEEVYVQEILPNGLSSTRCVPLEGDRVAVNVRKYASVNSVASASSMPEVPVLEVPSSFDVVIDATPSATVTLGDETTYLIPAGATVEGNLSLSNWHNDHAVLYVAGTLRLGSVQMDKASLVVLDGGRVELDALNASTNTSSKMPTVYVEKEGRLTMGSANISSNKLLVNYGSMHTGRLLDLNGHSSLYNLGVLEGNEDGAMKFSNNTSLHNDGTVRGGYFEINSSTELYNFENGIMELAEYAQTNSSGYLLQKGRFEVAGDADFHGKADIFCSLKAGRLAMESTQFTMYPGSYTETGVADLNNSKVHMDGALFVLDRMEQRYNQKFDSDKKAAWSVIRINERTGDWRWQACAVSGNIEIVHPNMQDGDGDNSTEWYGGTLKGNARMVRVQTVDLAASDCNAGNGTVTPLPEDQIVDKDGDGVPENEDIDDDDPEVAHRLEGTLFTYCFEDKWPWKGDYDMNDLVVAVRYEQITNAANRVVWLAIHWETLAVGSYNTVSAAIQLDRIDAGRIARVEATHAVEGSAPFVVVAGLESGMKQAVLPLFNSAREVMGDYTAFANTEKGKPRVATAEQLTKVKFTQPVDPADVAPEAINLFIVSNPKDEMGRGNEIHLVGYEATAAATPYDKAVGVTMSLKERYKTSDGMMWGLMIPGRFAYPKEFADIGDAYTNFSAWARSGGTTHADWYRNASGRNEELLY